MATGTTIKDRCRLCYTLLKDSSIFHQKHWCPKDHHRLYNIYQRRPYRYRDLIVRYLCIHLPENEPPVSMDHYSRLVCGHCAAALDKLQETFRTFQQTRKSLRTKFRKTSHLVQHQLQQQQQQQRINGNMSKTSSSDQPIKEEQEKLVQPKRHSKRKGEPKHIDQTHKSSVKTTPSTNVGQLIVKVPTDKDETQDPSHHLRTSPRRKTISLLNSSEEIHPKKKLKRLNNESETSTCVNLLKSSILTDLPINNHSFPMNLSSSSNHRLVKPMKGNHIERIAVSLLSGTETLNDTGTHPSNGTEDHQTIKTRGQRKAPTSLELSTTNNILCPVVRSPSLVDEPDDDRLSIGGTSNDSSGTNPSTGTSVSNVNNKQVPPSSISTTPTAEGLTITAINPTGQKQVFMAKQLGNLKKYQCGLCEKIVTNIQIHVRRHTNDKPYPCTYCEKRFTNSGDLQIHVRIHTGEKPYACPLCLKSYRTIGNFNSHVKTHDSGVRPHRCELCNQIFPIPKDWYSHLRSSHRSRTAGTNNEVSSSTLNASKTTTVTKPLLANNISSQSHNEIFVPSKMRLEPINRSQLIIKTSAGNRSDSENDDQEPVNMSKKDEFNEDEDDDEVDDDDDDDVEENNPHPTTRNLLTNVASPVHA